MMRKFIVYNIFVKSWFKRYFIPHTINDYQPHILQRTAVVCMGLLVLLTFLSANMQALLWKSSDWLISTILPAVIVDLTNDNRAEAAVGTLRRSAVLDEAATLKAQHMAQYSYFAHYAPDGTSPWYWFDQVGYDYVHAGENLAVHFSDSGQVVEAWMNSPTHRENIVNPNYTEIGIGTARGTYQGFDTVFVVQLFGYPVVPTTAPVVSNAAPAIVEPTPVPVPESLAVADSEILKAPTEVLAESETLPEPVTQAAVAEVEMTDAAPLQAESEAEMVEVGVPEAAEVADLNAGSESAGVPVEPSVEVPEVVQERIIVPTAIAGMEARETLTAAGSSEQVYPVARLATQPQAVLQFVYLITAVFVLVALALSIVIEIRKQHPIQIAYGIGLILLMVALNYLHISVTDGALIAQAAVWVAGESTQIVPLQ